MSEPWEDFGTNKSTTTEEGPWQDFQSGPWEDFQQKETPSLQPVLDSPFKPQAQFHAPTETENIVAAFGAPQTQMALREHQGKLDTLTTEQEIKADKVSNLETQLHQGLSETDDPLRREAFKGLISEKVAAEGYLPVKEEPTAMQAATTPLVNLPRLQSGDLETLGLPEGASKVIAGAQKGIVGATEFLTTPLGVATLGTGALPAAQQKAVSAAFALDMAVHVPEQFRELGKAIGEGDVEKATETAVSAAASLYFTKKAAEHATSPPESAKTFIEEGQRIEPVQEPLPEGHPALDFQEGVGPGMGAALKEGEPQKAQVAQLTDSIRALAESSPEPVKQVEAFDIGQKLSEIKDGISENLNALKAAGSYLKEKFIGKPVVTEMDKAVGNRHLALTDSAINNRTFVETSEKAVPDKITQAAISKWADTGGNEDLLKQGLAETKDAFKPAYEKALNLSPEQKLIAQNLRNYFDSRLDDAINAGVLEDGIENYIHRFYPSDSPWKSGVLAELRSGIYTGKPALAKQRAFQYDFEAEKAGLKPEQSFIKRVAAYDLALNKAIADRQVVKDMLDIKMSDGRPMVDAAGVGVKIGTPDEGATLIKPSAKVDSTDPIDNRSDFKPLDAPPLRRWKWAGTDENGNPTLVQGDVIIHPDAFKRVKNLFERSAVRQNPVGRAMLKASATVKQTMLDLSGFHVVQIGVHGLEHRSAVPLSETVNKKLGREFRPLTDYINDPDIRGLVKGGLVLGETSGRELFTEGLSGSSLTKHIPKLGPKLHELTDWLFNDYIPRLKANTGLHALERNKERYKDLSPEELYKLTAGQMNAAFGEQNYAMIGRSETTQDILRLALLAPDFLESRMKFTGQAGTVYGREQFQALMIGAVAMYFAARVANKAINDEYYFEPKYAFSIVHGGKAYSLRTVQGDLIHLVTDFFGFARNRLNPIYGRTVLEALSGRDQFGRKRDFGQQLKDFASTIVPISLRGILNPREQSLVESALNAFGVTERRASSATEIYDLARKYKEKNQITEGPGEFIYDPDKDKFRAIRQAALYSDVQTTAKEIKKAIEKGVSEKQIRDHFSHYAKAPFVGKKSEENNFIETLSEDQKKLYDRARDEKEEVWESVRQALFVE